MRLDALEGGGVSAAAPATPVLRADPLADDTIAAILAGHDGSQWEAIAIVNRLLGQWQSNAIVAAWRAPEGTPAPIAAASPNGPVLRNVEGGSLDARSLYPEQRQSRPKRFPRSPVIGTDAPVQYEPALKED